MEYIYSDFSCFLENIGYSNENSNIVAFLRESDDILPENVDIYIVVEI